MSESAVDVVEELREFLRTSMFAVQIALAGLIEFKKVVDAMPRLPSNPDPLITFGVGDPNDPASEGITSGRLSELSANAAPGGQAYMWLSQQWIVTVHTGWEHEFRPRLAAAHGVPKDQIKHDLLGDVRLLRNDVVHHHGVVTPSNSGRCTVFGSHLPIGASIELKPTDFLDFQREFPYTQLTAGP